MITGSERLCLFLLTFPQWSAQICELLTDKEVESIFQTKCDTAPEYQVVPVLHSLATQNILNPKVHFKFFGSDVTLYLWRAEGKFFGKHTPIFTVETDKSSPRGLRYTKYDADGIYHAYQDESNNAAIIARKGTNNSYKFDGTFGQNFAIRSLPERVINEIINNNKSQHQKYNENYPQIDHHVIIKMKDVKKVLINLDKHSSNNSFPTGDEQKSLRKYDKLKMHSNVVYPEILTVIDYDTFKSFQSDVLELLVYLTAFWNGVDLRYKSLRDPKVHLNIATIIIGLDRNATPYLNNYRVNESKINIDSLQAMGHYFYAEERIDKNSYDIVIAVTRSTVCEHLKDNKNSSCVSLRGISQVGSACVRNEVKKAVESVGLIHDQGFNGIATAAHELAHILGVPHDGSPSPPYIGGPGATRCNWQDGYLMSSQRFGSNAFKWSDCSLECFKFFLKQPGAKCLYNKPKFDADFPRILPGSLLSLDQQCYEAGALEACHHDERACQLLYCTMPERRDQCFATAPAAEGSKCGDDKICIQGECVNQRQ
ncbi:venom metalloproteinase 3-like isoform X2 [Fopius arisanus]|uniref:Venom metalloproteinase 3-like isoform X2 n=1 Tax=Fopius arisanus TaxID=64838 RepID=A0A9R1U2I0_9HYME|nr:PREDICTED: venom metalloproteinase 3-like isoform X2 [Fopius arisanus]